MIDSNTIADITGSAIFDCDCKVAICDISIRLFTTLVSVYLVFTATTPSTIGGVMKTCQLKTFTDRSIHFF